LAVHIGTYAPRDDVGGQGDQARVLDSIQNPIDPSWLSKAAALIGGAADLAEQVSAGRLSLGDAHKTIRS